MKKFFSLFLTLVFAVSLWAGSIGQPKGFDKKLYDASYALYATSADIGFITPKFICTVTNYQRVPTGYLFIGAGHCTSVNPDLPADMTFFIEHDIDGLPMPVELIKAALVNESFASNQIDVQPLDYALFYLKTTAKLPTIALGDESSLRIGSKTTNVNFSLGLAKYVAHGIVSSYLARFGQASGFFGVQMFMSHGASGSSVVDAETHKIVGLVIAGEDGATVPAWIEPISVIEAPMKTLNVDQLIAHPDVPKVDRVIIEDFDTVSLLAGHFNGRGGYRGSHNSPNRVTPPPSRIAPPPNRIEPPANRGGARGDRHEGGRSVDHETRDKYFGHTHLFRPEIRYNSGVYSFWYAGLWFDFIDEYPFVLDDVFVDIDSTDGLYYLYSPIHPGVRIQIWIP